MILRGLNKGQKKEIYFYNKAKIFSSLSAYTDACTSSCKIVVASKRPLIKLEKGPTDKAKEPDPGGSDQQNLGYKKLKNRKTDRTVGLNYCILLCLLL